MTPHQALQRYFGFSGFLEGQEGTVTATGYPAEVFPRNIRGGRDPACREGLGLEMQHDPAHVTWTGRTSGSRDQPPAG